MIGLAQARTLALEHIHRPSPYRSPGDPTEFVILDDQTVEKPYGWVFFYDSLRHQQSGDPGERLAGNAPLLVTREGAVHVLGTAHRVEHYLGWYERIGSTSPGEGACWRVRVTGWRAGLQEVETTRTIRDHLGLGLAAAKALTDRVFAGEEVALEPQDAHAALALRDALERLGADAVVEPSTPIRTGHGDGR